jgi:hypothetical protein
MKKKNYITPAAKEVNLLSMEMLAASTKVTVSNTTTDQDATMTNEHRGDWGDLWK